MQGILKKLFENSQSAIDEGIYDVKENLSKSNTNLIESIKENQHATLITEIKFSSPSILSEYEFNNNSFSVCNPNKL